MNINESGENNWGLGIVVGEKGSSGFNQFISFNLTITGLLESQFQDQRVGMRVQSIEGTTNFSSGSSSKLIGTGGAVIVPEPALIAIFGLGLFGLALTRRNTTKRTQRLTA